MREIVLTATANNWRLFMLRRADSAFLTFQKKIHVRDEHTCQYCGFQARSHMETVNANGNYLDNKADNLVTACGLCAQCFFLEAVGRSDFGGGVLIYLPEMRQNELNALCHGIFASMLMRLDNAISAKNIYRSLKMRTSLIEEKIGEGFSNPILFGQMLVEASENKKQPLQTSITDKLRLLPNIARFSTEMIAWVKEGIAALG
ncbi:MAG: type IV secretion protein IcmJ [Gammaproteobacteria bacterium RIFCSPHIGHO2_12_FULL_45_9]|nr:MAG: type IV secretion protein IcmJ [Gammaproteobacteria bacterium RIFCSPHIGHO2_12_FULL_45_9]